MASGKTVENLKVAELKSELESRGCDSSGLKSALVSRLKEAIKNQGEDPEAFVFDTPATPGKESMKPNASKLESSTEDLTKTNSKDDSKNTNAEETTSTKGSNSDLSKNVEEDSNLMVVHVGDTFDLDYDLNGKNKAEDDGKEKPDDSTSEQGTTDVHDKAQSKNLWVSNIKDVRAAELRSHFSSVGKVLAARVFVNRTPRAQSKYYGFVQMASVEAADRCVKELNRSLINGQRIYVDKAKREVPVGAAKRPLSTSSGGLPSKKSAPSATSKVSEKKEPRAEASSSAATSNATSATAATASTSATKSEKLETNKESEKNSASSDRKNDRADPPVEKEKLEMVKKKEEDLERLKQRQLKLAKTQQLEFDRLAREKEKLRHEREAIERERRNLRKIRKEVESSSDANEGRSRGRRSWEEPIRERPDRNSDDWGQSSASHSRSGDAPRYFSPREPQKNFYRPSGPSGSDRSSRNFESEPRTSRGEREAAPSYRRHEDNRYSGGSSSYLSSRTDPAGSGQRFRDFGPGEPSRSRPSGRYSYEQPASRPSRSSYEQSSSSNYRRDSGNDYGSDYTRDYTNYNRQQPNTSSYYDKNYATDKNYARDRSPQRSSDRYGGSSSNVARHNPYYSGSSGGILDRGMGTSHRGPNTATMTPTFLGGSSSALGGSASNGPSSSSPMFLGGGGGGSSGSSFPPSGSYYGAAAVTSLAASALANSAAASTMRYDAYAAAAAASGRNVGGSMYHHSSRY